MITALGALLGCSAPPAGLVVVPTPKVHAALRLAVLVGYEDQGAQQPLGVHASLVLARDALTHTDPPFDVVVLEGRDANAAKINGAVKRAVERHEPNADDQVIVWVRHLRGAAGGWAMSQRRLWRSHCHKAGASATRIQTEKASTVCKKVCQGAGDVPGLP